MAHLNIIVGNSEVILKEWLSSPYVSDIFYIGDSERGLEIGKSIFLAGKKPILELSGNDMMFVWKDCNVKKAVNSALDAFLGSTQICIAPKKIVVHQEVYENFVKLFIKKIKKMKFGLPSNSETCFTPVIKISKFFEFLQDAIDKGASLLYGGKCVNYRGEVDPNGTYIQPTIISIEVENVQKIYTIKCIKKENFFPLIPILKVTSNNKRHYNDEEIFNKMIELAELNEYGLRVSVWVNSPLYIKKFVKYLNSGTIRVNSKHMGYSYYLPVQGGIKTTGGPFGELNYMWQKTSYLQGVSIIKEKK